MRYALIATIVVSMLLWGMVSMDHSLADESREERIQNYLQSYTNVEGLEKEDLPSHPSEVIQWLIRSAVLHSNHVLEVTLELKSSRGFHLYHDQITFHPPAQGQLTHRVVPTTVKLNDPVTRSVVDVYKDGLFDLAFTVDADQIRKPDELGITYLGCSQHLCLLPTTEYFKLDIVTVDYPYQPSSAHLMSISGLPKQETVKAEPSSDSQPFRWDHSLARQLSTHSLSFWWLLVLCLVGGVLTNLTPCVYPMIPITLSALSNIKPNTKTPSSKQTVPIHRSLVYAAGLFSMYTLLGLGAALSGSVLGSTSASMSLNIGLAVFLAWMSLSMLGLTQLGFLQRFGHRLGGGATSYKQTYLMGVSAGFVAAPCTGPILAGLMSYAFSHLSVLGSTVAFSTYSLGFAAPYLFIGPMISFMSRTKIPSPIQMIVKIMMASAILALSFYYLRIPLYNILAQIQPTIWIKIIWVFTPVSLITVIAAVTMRFMKNQLIYQLGPTLSCAILFFAASQHWSAQTKSDLSWQTVPIHALNHQIQSPTVVALWAEWCTACKIMESTTFSHPEITSYFDQYNTQLIKYDVTLLTQSNHETLKTLKVTGLPAYVLMDRKDQNIIQKNLQGFYDAPHFHTELENFFE